jgi:hypothetical protein
MKLGLRWFAWAALLAPIAWSALYVVAALLGLDTDPLAPHLLGALIMWFFGSVVTFVLAPAYLILLLLWPRLCAAFPSVERSRRGLLIGTAGLAFPGALAISLAAEMASTDWAAFPLVLTQAFVSGWAALAIPRLLDDRLQLGAMRKSA